MSFGQTVRGQDAYTLPSEFDLDAGERILELTVNDEEYTEGAAEQARELAKGNLWMRGSGIYYLDHDDQGNEVLKLYPVPQQDGLGIEALIVVEPDELTDDNPVPRVPRRFRPAIVDYAASRYYGSREDNPELRSYYEQQFERKVAELAMLRNSRGGRKVVQVQIEGVHY